MKHDIPLLSLPSTFRDAIEVTTRLLVDYLWIDSLCIVQKTDDDSGDWQHEASHMIQMYQNAFCNISATRAEDCTQGLIFARNPSVVTPRSIEASLLQSSFRTKDQKLYIIDSYS